MVRFFEIFCRTVDRIAGILIALVTVLVVASVIGRYGFASPIPGAYDIARLLIGACIMWGFAAVGYRGGHISVDIVFELLSNRGRRIMDIFAWTVLLIFVVALAWKMSGRVLSARASGEATFDIALPIWPFLALVWSGVAASIVTVSVRIVLLALGRVDFEPTETQRVLAEGVKE
jgi:TRAP-type C4-dicarboxylate transport system permease small subunit